MRELLLRNFPDVNPRVIQNFAGKIKMSTEAVEKKLDLFFDNEDDLSFDNFRSILFKKIDYSCNYPNNQVEFVIEKILYAIEFETQRKYVNNFESIARDNRVNHKKIDKMTIETFNNKSVDFQLFYYGNVELKTERKDDFINAINSILESEIKDRFINIINNLIISYKDNLKLLKVSCYLTKDNFYQHLGYALCSEVCNNLDIVFIDWLRDILIDYSKLYKIFVRYINWSLKVKMDDNFKGF